MNPDEPPVLITGATQGLGRAISLELASRGYTLILVDRNRRHLEKFYDEFIKQEYPEPVLQPVNLAGAGPDDYITIANALYEEFGALQGLVHNAAAFSGLTTIDNIKPLTWFETMQINLNAPFLLTQTCLPLLRKAKDAALVFVTDNFGDSGFAYRSAYSASKAGLDALMHTIAEEEEEHSAIKVFSFDPGMMETAMLAKIRPAHKTGTLPSVDTVAQQLVKLMESPRKDVHNRILHA